MDGLDNILITISGEPASGKSTAVGFLEQKYKEKGYNVITINAGHIFRKMVIDKYYEMHPEINKENINISDVQNDSEFSKVIRQEIDTKLDDGIAEYVKYIQTKATQNQAIIVDSRLAWKNIPNSYSVRLTVAEEIAGKRVFNDKTRGAEDSYSSLQEAIDKTKKRKLGEIERYKQRYGVDLTNPDNYNLIVDTAYSNSSELADIIINGEKAYREGQYYPKNWASPAHFLPTQKPHMLNIRCKEETIEGLGEKIKKEGFNSTEGEIYIGVVNDVKYINDGHHRALASLAAGLTLVPYRYKGETYPQYDLNDYYDWSDGIRYYGGIVGNINQLKQFDLKDIINIEKEPTYIKSVVKKNENEKEIEI